MTKRYDKSYNGRAFYWVIEQTLRNPDRKMRYVSDKTLGHAIRANPGVPLPPRIHAYLCDRLEGRIRKPVGRKGGGMTDERNHVLRAQYARYFDWLSKRKRSLGLDGWSVIRDTDWWRGPPSERAARMAVRSLRGNNYFPTCDWRTALNLVHSQK